MPEKQVKSKQRVADHGEVFTAEREVNAMLDLVKQETERIESRFLEPACGEGAFLTEILRRKLAVVKKRYGKSPFDYERYAVLAVSSIYGVDILADNAEVCRSNLFDIWNREYTENAFIVKNLEKKTLIETGIQNCDVAIVCIGEHMDTSILTTLNLVSMGIPKVISKAMSSEHGVILKKLGAEIVFPEKDMAVRLASRLETERMLDFVQLSEKINVSKMNVFNDCPSG